MKESDERRMLRAVFGEGAGCLPVEKLAALEEASGAEAAHLNEHVANCPRCRAELALLRSFHHAEPSPEEAADVAWISRRLEGMTPGRPAPAGVEGRGMARRILDWLVPTQRRLAWVAVACLVVAAGLYLQRQSVPGRPRFAREGEVMRSGAIAAVAPAGELERVPSEFRWKPVSGAASYRVRLLAVDKTELWKNTTTSEQMAVPQHLIRRGSAFHWEVTALDASGRGMATSNLQSFHVLLTTPGSQP